MDLQLRQTWRLFDSVLAWQNTQAVKVSFLPISGTEMVSFFAWRSLITSLQREHVLKFIVSTPDHFQGYTDLLFYLLSTGFQLLL
jgi:hypothetical protein